FYFQHIDAIPIFTKLAHAVRDDVRLLLRVFKTLFVSAFIIADELEEVWDIVGAAFVTNALNPGVLLVIYILGIIWRVIQQNFYAIRAGFLQSLCRPVVEKIAKATRPSLVIAGLFIGEQQPGISCATFRRRQPPLRIEQNRACMRRQNFSDEGLEFFHHCGVDFAAFFLGS